MPSPAAPPSAVQRVASPVEVPAFAPQLPRSPDFRLRVNGRDVPVLRIDGQADLAIFAGPGPFAVEIGLFVRQGAAGAVVHPQAAGIVPEPDGWRLRLTLPGPMPVAYVEIPGLRPLALFAHAPEAERPDPQDPKVRFFAAGGVYEPGEIQLRDGETLYIESGALVRGWVRASEATGVRVCGRGILDGFHPDLVAAERHRMLLVFDRCSGVQVEDVTLVRPRFWTLALGACAGVVVRGLRALTELISTDGIDVVGSSYVLIEGCFLANNDDCVALKAAEWSYGPADGWFPWRRPVERVVVRGCTLLNRGAGNVFEIGHETACARIGEVLFEDCEVIAKHGHGAVFAIHNGDEALVEDITWRRIRVSHHFDKLFDLRVVPSVFSDGAGSGQGRIRRVRFESCEIAQTPFNRGYTVSLAGGYVATAPLADLAFVDCTLGGQPVTHLDALQLHLRHAVDVRVNA